MKQLFTAIILFLTFSFNMKGQTNVSGIITANTTWTQANSPYIVTSTVTVDPGYTLTIQPGVTVKLAGNLEIKRSNLIAVGTITDSIIFTSNMANPTKGSAGNIILTGGPSSAPGVPQTHKFIFEYCKIQYSSTGIDATLGAFNTTQHDSLWLKNSYVNTCNLGAFFHPGGKKYIDSCVFKNNTTAMEAHDTPINASTFAYNGKGFYITYGCNFTNCSISNNGTGFDYLDRTIIDNCLIKRNNVGISQPFLNNTIKNSVIDSNTVSGIYFYSSSMQNNVENCTLRYNGTAISHSIQGSDVDQIKYNIIEYNGKGVVIGNSGNTINLFCNKICNNTQYDLELAYNGNVNVANNYWCSNNPTVIASHIYDGYDNSNLGVVTYAPFDTVGCYLSSGTEVSENAHSTIDFNVYPNPATNVLTISLAQNTLKSSVIIYNLLGEVQFNSLLTSNKSTIDVSSFAKGVYVIEVNSGNVTSRQKFMKQ